MSIPERLWRVARGRWLLSQQGTEDLQADAAALAELEQHLRSTPVPNARGAQLPPTTTQASGMHDPLEACYALLQVNMSAAMDEVERAYEARLAELNPDAWPAGSAERELVERRRVAVTTAYEKVRDLLNPTEGRFDRLEF